MSNNIVRAKHPNGTVEFMPIEEGINLLKSGDAVIIGHMQIRLRPPKGGSIHGPSCGVQGSVRGKGEDGKPRLSYVEKLAMGIRVRAQANEVNSDGKPIVTAGDIVIDYREELREIGRIHHRILNDATSVSR